MSGETTPCLFPEDAPAPPSPAHAPIPDGLVCKRCGRSEFKTTWQAFSNGTRHIRCDCAACGTHARYLKQPGPDGSRFERRSPDASAPSLAPPSDDFIWIGYVRQADEVWRPVAKAPTLGRCWDALLSYPGEGDYLCAPSHDVNRTDNSDN